MGLFEVLGGAALILDALSGPSGKKYEAVCESLELFEIGTTWKGTVRVHGAGEHLKTIRMTASTTIFYPDKSESSKYTRRGLLRKDLRDWAGKEFALSGTISKDMVVLNEGENCLSIEGYIKEADGGWKLVNDAGRATNFGAFKVYIKEKDGAEVGYEELHYLFKEETVGRISSVDVTDGF